MTTPSLLDRVAAEIERGRAWKAKELLRGNIAAGRVDPEILEAYGQLLEALGDRVEAGKYLFLSGARTEASRDAISIFLARHRGRNGSDLIAQLPTAVRRRAFVDLPSAVQQDLRAMGVSPDQFGPETRHPTAPPARQRLALMAGLVAMAVLALATLVGLWTLVSWLVAEVG